MTPFCNKSHYVGANNSCEHCDWRRPVETATLGNRVWSNATDLNDSLGGSSGAPTAIPAIANGIACFPTNGGEFIGIDAETGKERWRMRLGEGLVAHSVISDGAQFYVAASDVREMHQAGQGGLFTLNPTNGKARLLYAPETFWFSDLVLRDDFVYFITANRELQCFSLKTSSALWKQELAGRTQHPPLWVDGPEPKLVTFGTPSLFDNTTIAQVFRAQDGSLLSKWAIEKSPKFMPLAIDADHILLPYQRKLQLHRVLDGEMPYHSCKISKLYHAPLRWTDDTIVFIARNESKKYALATASIADLSITWQRELATRNSADPSLHDDVFYYGDREGALHAIDLAPETVQLRWEVSLKQGNDIDPIRSVPVFAGDGLLIGTHAGQISRIKWRETQTELLPVEDYLVAEDWEQAALVYVLQSSQEGFVEAAKLYEGRLNDIAKATELYKLLDDHAALGRIYEQQHKYYDARSAYEKVDQPRAVARMNERLGDKVTAAEQYAQLGDYLKAGDLYYASDYIADAVDAYGRAGAKGQDMRRKIGRELGNRGEFERIIKMHLDNQEFEEAIEHCVDARHYQRAVQILETANADDTRVYALLKEAAQQEGEPWAWARLPRYAKDNADLVLYAQALEKNEADVEDIAEAYDAILAGCDEDDEIRHPVIAGWYEKARDHWFAAGDLEKVKRYALRIRFLRKQPYLDLSGDAQSGFKEGEWNIFNLTLTNVGFRRAQNIYVTLDDDDNKFEIVRDAELTSTPNLMQRREKNLQLHAMPRDGVAGRNVPFRVKVTWEDIHGNTFDNVVRLSVHVIGKNNSQEGAVAANITYNGPVLHPGAKLTQIQGDMVNGQKGDKVEISKHNKTVAVIDGLQICKECNAGNTDDSLYCCRCGSGLRE